MEIDFVILLGNKDETCCKLAHMLPMSIERVTLEVKEKIALKTLAKVVCRMVKSKMKRLPNLAALTFNMQQRHQSSEMDLITELTEKWAEVGVLLSITESSNS